MKASCMIVLFWILTFGFFFPDDCVRAASSETSISEGNEESGGIGKELMDGFGYSVRVLGYGVVTDIRNTPVTFGREKDLGLSTYKLETDLRPDLRLDFRRLELGVKPRFNFFWEKWEEGSLDGDSRATDDIYVNEWLARCKIMDNLFASYGRENLQWGPSYLLSPSNPFIRNNGKNNPKIEVAGTDFARTVWIPSAAWSVSLIANTEEGEEKLFEGFERGYAAKVDYTGDKRFFSLIPQYQEDGDVWMGYYGGWNVSDALLLHSEGRVSDDEFQLLGGASYTLELGPTLTAEYYHNSSGSRVDPIWLAFPPYGDVSPDDQLYRKNYILLQAMDNRIKDVFSITLRWICDLDDGSSRSIAILEYDLTNHIQLYTIGAYDSGGSNDEFGSAIKYSSFTGIQYVF